MTNQTNLKKPIKSDWHSADIVAALHKRGVSFAQLGFANGYTNRGSLAQVLHKPYPAAEVIVARELGLRPEEIWPSRYNKDGTSNRVKGRKPMRPSNIARLKDTTSQKVGNPQDSKAA